MDHICDNPDMELFTTLILTPYVIFLNKGREEWMKKGGRRKKTQCLYNPDFESRTPPSATTGSADVSDGG